MGWSQERIIQMIEAYRSHRCLWDPTYEDFKNKTRRQNAWRKIAVRIERSVEEVIKKMESLLAYFRRERQKSMYSKSSNYRSKWFAFKSMQFLMDKYKARKKIELNAYRRYQKKEAKCKQKEPAEETIEEEEHLEETLEEPSSDPEEYDDNGSNSPINIIIKEEPEIITTSPQRYYRTVKTTMQNRINKRKLEKEKLHKLAEKKKRLLENKLLKGPKLYKKKDECDSFGEYIAVSLRKHDERTRSMIKQAINNILFEQEMKKYNSGQYTVIYAGSDVNPLIVPDDCEK